MRTASNGLLGMEDHPAEDFRDREGGFATDIQSHLVRLQGSPALAVDRRVITAATAANGDAGRLVQNLAQASRAIQADPTPQPLVSIHALGQAQLLLTGSGDGPPHPASAAPESHRERLHAMLQDLSHATALALHASMLNAAVLAQDNPARLLDHLSDLVGDNP